MSAGNRDAGSSKRALGPAVRLVVTAGSVLAMTALGLTLVPSATGRLGPSSVSVTTTVGAPETVLRLPPFGSVSARTHPTPVRIQLEVEEVDIEKLAVLATSPAGRAELTREVRLDLKGLLVRAVVQVAVGGALLGALTGIVIFHRRWGAVALCSAAGGALVVVLLATTAWAYDIDEFEQPRFSGTLTKARVVVDALQERVGLLDEAGDRYRIMTKRVSNLLVLLAGSDPDPRASDTVVLHVSDIHANPIAFDVMRQLVDEFDVDAVIDTGDAGSATLDTGEISSLVGPVDDALAREMRSLRVAYLFISGNHDSFQFRQRLERVPNVEVLDGEVVDVNGLEILGWGDPTFSTTPMPEDQKSQERRALAAEVATVVRSQRPDVLAVHDEVLAAVSLGTVPLVLAGHTHERDLEVVDETVLATVGSTGATGLKAFTVESDRSYEAEIVYFRADEMVAIDYIEIETLEGDFVLDRTTFSPG